MDAVLRGIVLYVFLLLVFRIAGKRTLSEATTFDFVLLLIVAEATQQGLLGEDYSLTNAFLVIVTLVAIDVGLSLLKERSPTIERWIDGVSLVLIEDGRLHRDRMTRVRGDELDILETAHDKHGLERLDQIRYAILERSGRIAIIPKEQG